MAALRENPQTRGRLPRKRQDVLAVGRQLVPGRDFLVFGEGFGIALLLRYVLEFCQNVAEAVAVLCRVPVHVAYNVALLDGSGRHATVFIAPDRPPRVEPWLVSANRQAQDAHPDEPSVQDSALREAVVQARLADPTGGAVRVGGIDLREVSPSSRTSAGLPATSAASGVSVVR